MNKNTWFSYQAIRHSNSYRSTRR